MKITKEEILKKFNKEEMAGLLVGAAERSKSDKGLIEWMSQEIYDLKEKIKEMEKKYNQKYSTKSRNEMM